MKICLLAPANNPHTQKIAYILKQKGYIVNICTFHNVHLPNIEVKYFPQLIKPLGKLNYILNSKLIKEYLKKSKPDILHAHYVSSYGITGFLTGFHPFIISVWGRDIYHAPSNIFLKYFIKKALANADSVLSTSKTMAEHTKRFVKNKEIIVTPFGIDLTKFHPQETRRSRKFTVGTARILAPKYGIKYLIEAFADFTKEVSEAVLHIAGDGPQKNELVSLSNHYGLIDRVKFFGFIKSKEIPDFLSNLDIFCMPSIDESESFGVAALEAQACGLPVIASKVGGLHETVVDNKTGFLIEPRNSNEITKKLLLLYQNQRIRKQMSKQAIAFVASRYDSKQTIKKIEKQYNELLERSSV